MFASRARWFNRFWRLPALRLACLEEPEVEEARERDARVGLGQRDELLGRTYAVAVLRHPVAQDRIEDRVADLLAESLERQPAAEVDGRREELLRPRSAWRQLPEVPIAEELEVRAVIGLEDPSQLGVVPPRLPQPLAPGGEALVEPDVLPLRQRDRVPEPLMGSLMSDHHRSRGTEVDGLGLGL